MAFENPLHLVAFAGFTASLLYDFFIKTTGRSDLYESVLRPLPLTDQIPALLLRGLLLNCLTNHYSHLWRECWNEKFTAQRWTKSAPQLDNARFTSLAPEWRWESPLRADFERRQAQIEIDVLVARALQLSLEQLRAIYRIQFPVLRQNELDTWYDQNGRIVFTNSKAVPGVGFSRQDWERIKTTTCGSVTRTIQDDTQPGGPRERVIEYVAPFDRCDREDDYATAWKFFDEADV
jgi:hypothetical protein